MYVKKSSLVNGGLVLFGIMLIAEIVYIILVYYEKTHYSLVAEHTQEYLDMEKKHFDDLREREQDTRRFRHDMNGHLAVLNRYVGQQNLEKAEEYLQSIMSNFSTLERKYHTGNEVIDSILEQKNPQLEEHHITLTIDGSLHAFEGIDDFDLCTIFSNALQNAIEACMELPETIPRKIQVYFRTSDDTYRMEFHNPVKEHIKIKKRLPKTTKTDLKNHGFGLIQIQHIVNSHNGNLSLSCKDHTFQLIADLQSTNEEVAT